MIFNKHSSVAGRHAFLSASQHHWVRYDDQKLSARFISWTAAKRGSDLHELAQMAITLGVKLAKTNPTLSMYVNDAIGYKMETEQPLYYSENCFGTADAICFRKVRGVDWLRIHDLKTGLHKASFEQLEIYAAIFCLEYHYSPYDIEMEFRIYQSGQVHILPGDPEVIQNIMDTIVDFDKKLELLKQGGEL